MSQSIIRKVSLIAVIILTPVCFVESTLAQEIQWQDSLERATEMAAKENKLVLLHFTAEWCRPCKALETFVFSSPMVQHALSQNVIAVKVDVDLQPDLVKEYGVSAIPVDIVLTPTGRVVAKRKSPSTTDDYVRMVKNLNKVLAGMHNGNPTIAQNLDELKERSTPKTAAIAEHNQFQVSTPSHEAPKITYNGVNLARGNTRMSQNPFFQPEPASRPKTAIAKTETIHNEFSPQKTTETENGQMELPKPSARYLAKLENPSIRNRFFDREQESAQPRMNNALQPILAQETVAQGTVAQTDDIAFALHGKCPVTLITQSKWVDGDERWGCVHRGRTYLFASQTDLQKFQADPDKYSPLLAGYDPVVYHERGELVPGLEENGVFMGMLPNLRIILFNSPESEAKFRLNPRDYIETVRQAMSDSGDNTMQVR